MREFFSIFIRAEYGEGERENKIHFLGDDGFQNLFAVWCLEVGV
jgi:hypothetical protein